VDAGRTFRRTTSRRGAHALGMAVIAVLALAVPAAAAELNVTGTWQVSYHCESGSCAGREESGGTTLSEAAGSSAVSGTWNVAGGGGGGSVNGTLTGSTLTLQATSANGYSAKGVETISADGLSWNGSYEDSSNTKGTLTASRPSLPVFETTPGARRPSATQVLCNYEVAPANFTCTAQVGDASAASPAKIPTGTVAFTAPSGSFLPAPSCTLVATPGSPNVASCSVTYATTAKIPVGTPAPVTGSYSGDSVFAASAAKSGAGAVVSPTVGSATSTGEGAKTTVSCPAGAASCPIVVGLYVEESGGAITARKAKRRRITIGSTKLTLKAGQKRAVTVSLNRAGKRLLAKHRNFTALLKVTSGATTIKTQKVKIRPKNHS
jgi:hypothetical protein